MNAVLLWAAAATAGVPLGVLVLLYLFCVCRSRFCFKRRSGKQEAAVPHTAPVELYYCSTSVKSQKLRGILEEKGVDARLHDLDAGAFGVYDHLTDEALRMNPNGSLPYIVHEGRPVLGEIFELFAYIDTTFPTPRLVPEPDGTEKATKHQEDMCRCLQYVDEALNPAVRVLCKPAENTRLRFLSTTAVFRALLRHPNPWPEYTNLIACFWRHWRTDAFYPAGVTRNAFAIVATGIDYFEKLLEDGRDFLAGTLSAADICVAAEFHRLELLGLLDGQMGEKRRVRAYWARMRARGSFKCFTLPAEAPGPGAFVGALARLREDIAARGPMEVYGLEGSEEEEER